MQKICSFILASCLITSIATAQSVSPEVLTGAGGSAMTHAIQIDWTLGEVAVERYADSQMMITEGFHQPVLVIEELLIPAEDQAAPAHPDPAISQLPEIMPNPTRGWATLRFQTPLKEKVGFLLFNSAGMQVARFDLPAKISQHELDLTPLPAGIYVLKMVHAGQTSPGLFRVTKTQ